MNRLCVVCYERPKDGHMFCKQCGRAWDAYAAHDAATTGGDIEWAAKRARWFERRRGMKAVKKTAEWAVLFYQSPVERKSKRGSAVCQTSGGSDAGT